MKFLTLLTVLALPCLAKGQVSLEFIGSFYATDVSADGSVVAGNTSNGDYETCRWTAQDGLVLLGNSTVPYIGTGAGGGNQAIGIDFGRYPLTPIYTATINVNF